jgi:hypothetical protein
MPPEPCDTGIPEAGTVPPLHWWDLCGQLTEDERGRIRNVTVRMEGVL